MGQARRNFAKTFQEQFRTAVLQIYQENNLIMKSRMTMVISIDNAGTFFALAGDQFDKITGFHTNQYEAALELEYMDKMFAESGDILPKARSNA